MATSEELSVQHHKSGGHFTSQAAGWSRRRGFLTLWGLCFSWTCRMWILNRSLFSNDLLHR